MKNNFDSVIFFQTC